MKKDDIAKKKKTYSIFRKRLDFVTFFMILSYFLIMVGIITSLIIFSLTHSLYFDSISLIVIGLIIKTSIVLHIFISDGDILFIDDEIILSEDEVHENEI